MLRDRERQREASLSLFSQLGDLTDAGRVQWADADTMQTIQGKKRVRADMFDRSVTEIFCVQIRSRRD